jgi:hypothetical protein
MANKTKVDAISIRECAAEICDVFEELLADHGILIPNDEREGEEDEACLFGDDYYWTEDSVVEILTKLLETVKNNPDAKIQEDFV